jgi:hypothetical protein
MLRLALLLLLFIVTWNASAVEGEVTVLDDESSKKNHQDKRVNKHEMDEEDVLERLKNIGDIDPVEWGIRNNCIALRRIKHIRFVDDQSAIIEMRGNKKALLRLRRECRGIKSEGFLHKARGGSLCVRFDRLEVQNRGMTCSIESIEPYFVVESQPDSDIETVSGDPK